MSTPPRLAIVTASTSVDLYEDGTWLLPALDRAGVEAIAMPWGERLVSSHFDGALIRSTWDYIDDRDAFLAWCAATAREMPLANPLGVLRWNTDKTYLRDLQAAGVPVVPTLWIGDSTLPEIPWDRFVVKPAVSAGGRHSASYARRDIDLARRHIEGLVAARKTVMVQPHVESVDRDGEFGTYVIGGRVSHAVHKASLLVTGRPAVDDLSLAVEQVTARAEVTDELTAFAHRVVDAVPRALGDILYARVDTVRDAAGALLLLELELVEPYLFLDHDREAADVVAAAVAAWLRRSRRDSDGL